MSTGLRRRASLQSAAPETAVEAAILWWRGARQTALEALRTCLSFGEQLLFFMIGWSWTYVFFPLASKASLEIAVRDFIVAFSLTTLAVVLIVLLPGEKLNFNRSGRISIEKSISRLKSGESARMAIFKQTLTTSSTFFVGWAYVVFFRDLAAVSGSTSIKLYEAFKGDDLIDDVSAKYGMVDAQKVSDQAQHAAQRSFLGALGGVLLFGPVLSVAVLAAKSALLSRFAAMGSASGAAAGGGAEGTGISIELSQSRQDVLRLERAAVRAKLSRMGMMNPTSGYKQQPMRSAAPSPAAAPAALVRLGSSLSRRLSGTPAVAPHPPAAGCLSPTYAPRSASPAQPRFVDA